LGFLIATNATIAAIAATIAATVNARWMPLFMASIEVTPLFSSSNVCLLGTPLSRKIIGEAARNENLYLLNNFIRFLNDLL
jgi:hypothetical protein